jgi:hypothetical protein
MPEEIQKNIHKELKEAGAKKVPVHKDGLPSFTLPANIDPFDLLLTDEEKLLKEEKNKVKENTVVPKPFMLEKQDGDTQDKKTKGIDSESLNIPDPIDLKNNEVTPVSKVESPNIKGFNEKYAFLMDQEKVDKYLAGKIKDDELPEYLHYKFDESNATPEEKKYIKENPKNFYTQLTFTGDIVPHPIMNSHLVEPGKKIANIDEGTAPSEKLEERRRQDKYKEVLSEIMPFIANENNLLDNFYQDLVTDDQFIEYKARYDEHSNILKLYNEAKTKQKNNEWPFNEEAEPKDRIEEERNLFLGFGRGPRDVEKQQGTIYGIMQDYQNKKIDEYVEDNFSGIHTEFREQIKNYYKETVDAKQEGEVVLQKTQEKLQELGINISEEDIDNIALELNNATTELNTLQTKLSEEINEIHIQNEDEYLSLSEKIENEYRGQLSSLKSWAEQPDITDQSYKIRVAAYNDLVEKYNNEHKQAYNKYLENHNKNVVEKSKEYEEFLNKKQEELLKDILENSNFYFDEKSDELKLNEDIIKQVEKIYEETYKEHNKETLLNNLAKYNRQNWWARKASAWKAGWADFWSSMSGGVSWILSKEIGQKWEEISEGYGWLGFKDLEIYLKRKANEKIDMQTMVRKLPREHYEELGFTDEEIARFEDHNLVGTFSYRDLLTESFWTTEFIRMLPLTTSMLVPALAGGVLGQRIGGIVSKRFMGNLLSKSGKVYLKSSMAGIVGAVSSRPFENFLEAGGAWVETLENGGTLKEAAANASSVYRSNWNLIGLDALQIGFAFTPLRGRFFKLVGVMAFEGASNNFEERYQEWLVHRRFNPLVTFSEYATSPEGNMVGILGTLNAWGFMVPNAAGIVSTNEKKAKRKMQANTLVRLFEIGQDLTKRKKELTQIFEHYKATGIITFEEYTEALKMLEKTHNILKTIQGMDDFELRAAQLMELSAEETELLTRIANAKDGTISEALKESHKDLKKQIKDIISGKAPGYFINGVPISKSEIQNLLENKEFVKQVMSGVHQVNILNDSALQKQYNQLIEKSVNENTALIEKLNKARKSITKQILEEKISLKPNKNKLISLVKRLAHIEKVKNKVLGKIAVGKQTRRADKLSPSIKGKGRVRIKRAVKALKSVKSPEQAVAIIYDFEKTLGMGATATAAEKAYITRTKNRLSKLGYTWSNPTHQVYDEKSNVEVVGYKENTKLLFGQRIIGEVISPEISKDGKVVSPAKVILEVGVAKENALTAQEYSDKFFADREKRKGKVDVVEVKEKQQLKAKELIEKVAKELGYEHIPTRNENDLGSPATGTKTLFDEAEKGEHEFPPSVNKGDVLEVRLEKNTKGKRVPSRIDPKRPKYKHFLSLFKDGKLVGAIAYESNQEKAVLKLLESGKKVYALVTKANAPFGFNYELLSETDDKPQEDGNNVLNSIEIPSIEEIGKVKSKNELFEFVKEFMKGNNRKISLLVEEEIKNHLLEKLFKNVGNASLPYVEAMPGLLIQRTTRSIKNTKEARYNAFVRVDSEAYKRYRGYLTSKVIKVHNQDYVALTSQFYLVTPDELKEFKKKYRKISKGIFEMKPASRVNIGSIIRKFLNATQSLEGETILWDNLNKGLELNEHISNILEEELKKNTKENREATKNLLLSLFPSQDKFIDELLDNMSDNFISRIIVTTAKLRKGVAANVTAVENIPFKDNSFLNQLLEISNLFKNNISYRQIITIMSKNQTPYIGLKEYFKHINNLIYEEEREGTDITQEELFLLKDYITKWDGFYKYLKTVNFKHTKLTIMYLAGYGKIASYKLDRMIIQARHSIQTSFESKLIELNKETLDELQLKKLRLILNIKEMFFLDRYGKYNIESGSLPNDLKYRIYDIKLAEEYSSIYSFYHECLHALDFLTKGTKENKSLHKFVENLYSIPKVKEYFDNVVDPSYIKIHGENYNEAYRRAERFAHILTAIVQKKGELWQIIKMSYISNGKDYVSLITVLKALINDLLQLFFGNRFKVQNEVNLSELDKINQQVYDLFSRKDLFEEYYYEVNDMKIGVQLSTPESYKNLEEKLQKLIEKSEQEGLIKDYKVFVKIDDKLQESELFKRINKIYSYSDALKIYHLTKLPEFKKWFKGSVIVNRQGEPLLMHHGSNRLRNRFSFEGLAKIARGGTHGFGFGHYTTNVFKRALEEYSKEDKRIISYISKKYSHFERQAAPENIVYDMFLNLKKVFKLDEALTDEQIKEFENIDVFIYEEGNEPDLKYRFNTEFSGSAYIRPSQVKYHISESGELTIVKNKLDTLPPYILYILISERNQLEYEEGRITPDDFEEKWDEAIHSLNYISDEYTIGMMITSIQLDELGYDGIEHLRRDRSGEVHYIIFDGNNMKSVNNYGNFQKESDNIYYSLDTEEGDKILDPESVSKKEYTEKAINELKAYIPLLIENGLTKKSQIKEGLKVLTAKSTNSELISKIIDENIGKILGKGGFQNIRLSKEDPGTLISNKEAKELKEALGFVVDENLMEDDELIEVTESFFITQEKRIEAQRAVFRRFMNQLKRKYGIQDPERLIYNVIRRKDFKKALHNQETFDKYIENLKKTQPEIYKAIKEDQIISLDELVSLEVFYGSLVLLQSVVADVRDNRSIKIYNRNKEIDIVGLERKAKQNIRTFTYENELDPNKALTKIYWDYFIKRDNNQPSYEHQIKDLYRNQPDKMMSELIDLYCNFLEEVTGVNASVWEGYFTVENEKKFITSQGKEQPGIIYFMNADAIKKPNTSLAVQKYFLDKDVKGNDSKILRLVRFGKFVDSISFSFNNVVNNREVSFELYSTLLKEAENLHKYAKQKRFKSNGYVQWIASTGQSAEIVKFNGIISQKSNKGQEAFKMDNTSLLEVLMAMFNKSTDDTYMQYLGQFADKKQTYLARVKKVHDAKKVYEELYENIKDKKLKNKLVDPKLITDEYLYDTFSELIRGSSEFKNIRSRNEIITFLKEFYFNYSLNKYWTNEAFHGNLDNYNAYTRFIKIAGSTNSPGYIPNIYVEGGVGQTHNHMIISDKINKLGLPALDGIVLITQDYANKLEKSLGSVLSRSKQYKLMDSCKALYSEIDSQGNHIVTKGNMIVIDNLANAFPNSGYAKLFEIMKKNGIDMVSSYPSTTKITNEKATEVFDKNGNILKNISLTIYKRSNENIFVQQDLRHSTNPNKKKLPKQTISNLLHLGISTDVVRLIRRYNNHMISEIENYTWEKWKELLSEQMDEERFEDLLLYIEMDGNEFNPFYDNILSKFKSSIIKKNAFDLKVSRVALQEVPDIDNTLESMKIVKYDGKEVIRLPRVNLNIKGIRYTEDSPVFTKKSSAISYASKFDDMLDENGDVRVWEIDEIVSKGKKTYVVPGEYVFTTRVPADFLHSHVVHRANKRIPGAGNIIITDNETQNNAGSDFDGDKRYVMTYGRTKAGKIIRQVKETLTKFVDISESEKKSPYFQKDLRKFQKATKFIANGEEGTSTRAYANAVDSDIYMTGNYSPQDRVAYSVNGGTNAVEDAESIKPELKKAMDAGATIIGDNEFHRSRKYNAGERIIAEYLEENGYEEIGEGIWEPIEGKEDKIKEDKNITEKNSLLNEILDLIAVAWYEPANYGIINEAIDKNKYDETYENLEKNIGKTRLFNDIVEDFRARNEIRAGAVSVGIAANISTLWSFLRNAKIKYKTKFNIPFPIYESTDPKKLLRWVSIGEISEDNENILKNHFGNLLNIMLDNVKDPKIERMGWNDVTAPIGLFLLMSMPEMDQKMSYDENVVKWIDQISTYLNTPLVKEYVKLKRKIMNPSFNFKKKEMWNILSSNQKFDKAEIATLKLLERTVDEMNSFTDFVNLIFEIPDSPGKLYLAESVLHRIAHNKYNLYNLENIIDNTGFKGMFGLAQESYNASLEKVFGNSVETWSITNTVVKALAKNKSVYERNISPKGLESIEALGFMSEDELKKIVRGIKQLISVVAFSNGLTFEQLENDITDFMKENQMNDFVQMLQFVNYEEKELNVGVKPRQFIQIRDNYRHVPASKFYINAARKAFQEMSIPLQNKFIAYGIMKYGLTLSSFQGGYMSLIPVDTQVRIGNIMAYYFRQSSYNSESFTQYIETNSLIEMLQMFNSEYDLSDTFKGVFKNGIPDPNKIDVFIQGILKIGYEAKEKKQNVGDAIGQYVHDNFPELTPLYKYWVEEFSPLQNSMRFGQFLAEKRTWFEIWDERLKQLQQDNGILYADIFGIKALIFNPLISVIRAMLKLYGAALSEKAAIRQVLQFIYDPNKFYRNMEERGMEDITKTDEFKALVEVLNENPLLVQKMKDRWKNEGGIDEIENKLADLYSFVMDLSDSKVFNKYHRDRWILAESAKAKDELQKIFKGNLSNSDFATFVRLLEIIPRLKKGKKLPREADIFKDKLMKKGISENDVDNMSIHMKIFCYFNDRSATKQVTVKTKEETTEHPAPMSEETYLDKKKIPQNAPLYTDEEFDIPEDMPISLQRLIRNPEADENAKAIYARYILSIYKLWQQMELLKEVNFNNLNAKDIKILRLVKTRIQSLDTFAVQNVLDFLNHILGMKEMMNQVVTEMEYGNPQTPGLAMIFVVDLYKNKSLGEFKANRFAPFKTFFIHRYEIHKNMPGVQLFVQKLSETHRLAKQEQNYYKSILRDCLKGLKGIKSQNYVKWDDENVDGTPSSDRYFINPKMISGEKFYGKKLTEQQNNSFQILRSIYGHKDFEKRKGEVTNLSDKMIQQFISYYNLYNMVVDFYKKYNPGYSVLQENHDLSNAPYILVPTAFISPNEFFSKYVLNKDTLKDPTKLGKYKLVYNALKPSSLDNFLGNDAGETLGQIKAKVADIIYYYGPTKAYKILRDAKKYATRQKQVERKDIAIAKEDVMTVKNNNTGKLDFPLDLHTQDIGYALSLMINSVVNSYYMAAIEPFMSYVNDKHKGSELRDSPYSYMKRELYHEIYGLRSEDEYNPYYLALKFFTTLTAFSVLPFNIGAFWGNLAAGIFQNLIMHPVRYTSGIAKTLIGTATNLTVGLVNVGNWEILPKIGKYNLNQPGWSYPQKKYGWPKKRQIIGTNSLIPSIAHPRLFAEFMKSWYIMRAYEIANITEEIDINKFVKSWNSLTSTAFISVEFAEMLIQVPIFRGTLTEAEWNAYDEKGNVKIIETYDNLGNLIRKPDPNALSPTRAEEVRVKLANIHGSYGWARAQYSHNQVGRSFGQFWIPWFLAMEKNMFRRYSVDYSGIARIGYFNSIIQSLRILAYNFTFNREQKYIATLDKIYKYHGFKNIHDLSLIETLIAESEGKKISLKEVPREIYNGYIRSVTYAAIVMMMGFLDDWVEDEIRNIEYYCVDFMGIPIHYKKKTINELTPEERHKRYKLQLVKRCIGIAKADITIPITPLTWFIDDLGQEGDDFILSKVGKPAAVLVYFENLFDLIQAATSNSVYERSGERYMMGESKFWNKFWGMMVITGPVYKEFTRQYRSYNEIAEEEYLKKKTLDETKQMYIWHLSRELFSYTIDSDKPVYEQEKWDDYWKHLINILSTEEDDESLEISSAKMEYKEEIESIMYEVPEDFQVKEVFSHVLALTTYIVNNIEILEKEISKENPDITVEEINELFSKKIENVTKELMKQRKEQFEAGPKQK